MSVTLDGLGVLLALTVAGVSVGSWAAWLSWNVRMLRKEQQAMWTTVHVIVEVLEIQYPGIRKALDEHAGYSARLLDHPSVRLRGAHRGV